MFDKEVKRVDLILRIIFSAVAIALCGLCLVACGKEGTDKATPDSTPKALTAPRELTIADEILSWDAVDGADGYKVEIDGKLYGADNAALDILSITDKPKTYSMRVRAVNGPNGTNVSEWSEPIEYTVQSVTVEKASLMSDFTSYSIIVTDLSAVSGKLVIPSTYKGLPISRVLGAFDKLSGVTSVYVPDSVVQMMGAAFSDCANISRVRLPSKWQTISNGMFRNCSGLKSIDFPEGLEEIGANAFMGCTSLTEIFLPKSVKTIGSYPFAGCDSLESITVDENNKTYKSDGNCLIKKSDNSVICMIKTSVMPDYITKIGEYAYYNAAWLTEITIPDRITSIGKYAFYNCRAITEITIPDRVSSIGEYAFAYCVGLTEITIPGNVKRVEDGAFRYCYALKKVTAESGVQEIGFSFALCANLEEAVLPDTLIRLGEDDNYDHNPFMSCPKLKSVTIVGNDPDPKYKTENNCIIRLSDNTLLTYCMNSEIPDYVERLGSQIFSSLPITRVTVKTGSSAEKEDGVLALPEGLTTIPYLGFTGCSALRTVQLPDSVADMTLSAFFSCDRLTSIIITDESKLDLKYSGSTLDATIYTSLDNVSTWRENNVCAVTGCSFGDDEGQLYVESFVLSDDRYLLRKQHIYAPYRKGYSFVGWAKDSPDGELLGSATLTKEGIDEEFTYLEYNSIKDLPTGTTLYAVWAPQTAAA